jgi:FkbM family methyltransferase
MSLHPVDLDPYLARPGEVDAELLRLFRHNAPLCILDIGACEGEESIRYARLFPHSRVLAFEPLPANQAISRANFARYAVPNAELVPLALSDRAGKATFHVSSGRPREEFSGPDWNYGNKSSSLLPPAQAEAMYGWIEFKETIMIPTDTLDHFCASRGLDHVDFVHMDVQGAEHLVLAGASAMLAHTTAVWLEVTEQPLYAGQKVRSEIEVFMRQRGFALAHQIRREIEGDQFYVNTRHACTWPYLAAHRLRGGLRRVRRLAGRIKRALPG